MGYVKHLQLLEIDRGFQSTKHHEYSQTLSTKRQF